MFDEYGDYMEHSAAEQLFNQLGAKDAMKALARLGGYREVPPTFDEFITEQYFAGLDECVGNSLYTIWKDVLRGVFPHPLYSEYNEICLTGAIGTGKSTCCIVGMLYDTCKLLFLKDPHRTFSLMRSTPLVIAFINATKVLSQSVLVDQFYSMCGNSEFFKEEMSRAQRLYGRRGFLPHRIAVMGGSRGNDSYGRGIVMAILSELNFQGAAVKDQAVQNYVHTSRRIKSRFGRGEGVLNPGRLWLDSSRKDETGFLENYVKTLDERSDVLMVSKAVWESQKSSAKFTFSGKEFQVFIGDDKRTPFILSGPGASFGVPEEMIISVPEEYSIDFELDIFGSLRDLAGIATWSGHRFFSNEGLVREQTQIKNPVYKPIIDLDASNPDDHLINYLIQDKPVDLGEGMVTPLSKTLALFIHFDLSKGKEGGDLVGIAITAMVGETVVARAGKRLIHSLERDLMFHTLCVMGVRAQPGQELPLSRMRNFVVQLCERGYNVQGVSADGYQSFDLLGTMKEAGIRCVEEISLDRNRDGYDHLKNCLIERRWSGPNHPILLKELLQLQDLGKKIDHPEDSGLTKERFSKDIADCVAGSVWNCKENSAGGKAISAFTAFSDQLAEAMRKPEGMKADLKKQGMSQRPKTWGRRQGGR